MNYLILILGNPLSLSPRPWWPGSCSSPRISHAGRHRRGTLLGLSLKLRLEVTHRLGPYGPQPIPSLKPKPKPKPNQRPRRAGLRATDTGPLTCAVTGYGSYACISSRLDGFQVISRHFGPAHVRRAQRTCWACGARATIIFVFSMV